MAKAATLRPLASPDGRVPIVEPERMTAGQRWRLRRDLVIYIANQQGVSQRMLADVFDLPHSRVATIIQLMRARYGSGSPAT